MHTDAEADADDNSSPDIRPGELVKKQRYSFLKFSATQPLSSKSSMTLYKLHDIHLSLKKTSALIKSERLISCKLYSGIKL